MAFDSFRDFVNALNRAGELKRIAQSLATELEMNGAAAVQNAKRLPTTHERREASWTAPALWRFAGRFRCVIRSVPV
jgi:hypothetical protein